MSIRNTALTMKCTLKFTNAPSKRDMLLKKQVGKVFCGLCETRWVEKHDSIIQFQESAHKIVKALQEILKWKDSNFVVSMACLSDNSFCHMTLSLVLQAPFLDLKDALCDTQSLLKSYQNISDIRISDLFVKAIFTTDYFVTDFQDRSPEERLKFFDFNLLVSSIIVENSTTEIILGRVQTLAQLYTFSWKWYDKKSSEGAKVKSYQYLKLKYRHLNNVVNICILEFVC
ncbi:hypothetical protein PR048_018293 [Dryococelus australis]|uniref:Uncharacterized protein n=1 Tax=Dryococelus australis TaxID=614101 RepID=A0ABQ9HBV2_9NEOP|nr:hypothetical protein PR048_018293 [Dryococelus australis]